MPRHSGRMEIPFGLIKSMITILIAAAAVAFGTFWIWVFWRIWLRVSTERLKFRITLANGRVLKLPTLELEAENFSLISKMLETPDETTAHITFTDPKGKVTIIPMDVLKTAVTTIKIVRRIKR